MLIPYISVQVNDFVITESGAGLFPYENNSLYKSFDLFANVFYVILFHCFSCKLLVI